jgi:hypothetical protein
MIAVGATVAVIGGIFAWREYQRPHASAHKLEASHVVSATELLADFQQDEEAATAKYVGDHSTPIEVAGTIRLIDTEAPGIINAVLDTGDPMSGVVCEFNENDFPADWRPGMDVRIKGFCSGMLMDVVIQRCVPII